MSIIEGDDNILLLTRELADQRKATKKKKGSNDHPPDPTPPRHEPQRYCILEIIKFLRNIFILKEVYFDEIVKKLDGE
jgi:hypothetical protein